MGADIYAAEEACYAVLKAALADADRATDSMRDAVGEVAIQTARLRVLDALETVDRAQDAWHVALELRLGRIR